MTFDFNRRLAMGSGCRLETLAIGEGCRIDHCGCGWIHLTVGTTTLRVRAGQCEELASVLAHAAAQLGRREARVLC
jgi:hypothetical protein